MDGSDQAIFAAILWVIQAHRAAAAGDSGDRAVGDLRYVCVVCALDSAAGPRATRSQQPPGGPRPWSLVRDRRAWAGYSFAYTLRRSDLAGSCNLGSFPFAWDGAPCGPCGWLLRGMEGHRAQCIR